MIILIAFFVCQVEKLQADKIWIQIKMEWIQMRGQGVARYFFFATIHARAQIFLFTTTPNIGKENGNR